MQIPKNISISELESSLSEIKLSQELRLPSSLSLGGGLGIEAALAQAVMTWARNNNAPTLHLYANENEALANIWDLATSSYGLSALLLASQIHDEQHNKISRLEALNEITPIIDAMYTGDLKGTIGGKGARPKTINLYSINHAEREYISPFYSGETVKPELEFSALVRKISETMLSREIEINKYRLGKIGTFLHELILNASTHGSEDLNRTKLKRALRGITVKHNHVKKEQIPRYSHGNPELFKFLSKNILTNNNDGLDFFEISVLDSGPGLAKHWLSHKRKEQITKLDSFSLTEERQATLECFDKHTTAKDSDESGMGLHNATTAMNSLKAFARLRTGRLSLQQAFDGTSKTEKFRPKISPNQENLEEIEGTLFTICIPVQRHESK